MKQLATQIPSDDLVLWSDKEEELQKTVNTAIIVTKRWGICINVNKTKTQVIQPTGCASYQEIRLEMDHIPIERVPRFKYLGSIIDENTTLDWEITNRIKSSQYCLKNLTYIWRNKGISRKSKKIVFEASVISRLLYGCATWNLTPQLFKKTQ